MVPALTAEERVEHVRSLAHALATAQTVADVAAATAAATRAALRARTAAVLAPPAGGATLALLAVDGIAAEEAPSTVGIEQAAARGYRTGKAMWEDASASLPLVVDGRPLAVVFVELDAPVLVEDRGFVDTLLEIGALSLDRAMNLAGDNEARARLADAERSARDAAERLAVILEAGEGIARASEADEVVGRLVQAAVPRFADWCAVDLARAGAGDRDGEGGAGPNGDAGPNAAPTELALAAVAHANPAKTEFARDLRARFPLDPMTSAPHRVVATGKPELYPEVTDEMLVASIPDEEQLRLTRELAISSVVIVPLVAHGRVLGALTLISSRPERRYDAADVRLADKLASRAAVALHNALLIGELRARAEAERLAREAEARARAEERAAKREAEAANRLKDEFLATVSHELRTPLNAILGWAALLRTDRLPVEVRARAIDTIDRNARAQARLVDDVLDVSRIISGKLALRAEPIDVATVLHLALDVVRPAALAKGVNVHASITPDLRVRGDADRLQQVYWNLLSNAVKFTPRGGTIGVDAVERDGAVVVTVRDTGQGIPPDFLAYIFEPFRQVDGTPTRAHGGLGLGLSIARHLVYLQGGEIAAQSEGAGLGSVFTVTLPATVDAPDAQTTGRHRPAARLLGVDVLVVDDDVDARELAAIVLVGEGASVRTAASAREAVLRIAEKAPAVLVCDIGMPDEDGIALLPRARALASAPFPAIAYTAYADYDSATRVKSAGFDAHVPKPVDAEKLVAAVAKLVA